MARSRRWRFWPRHLLSQMVVSVLLALFLAQGISLWLLSNAHRKAIEGHSQRLVLRQLASVVELLEETPVELHNKVLAVWRRPGTRFSFSTEPSVASPRNPTELLLAQLLERFLGYPDLSRIRLQIMMAGASEGRREWPGEDYPPPEFDWDQPRPPLSDLPPPEPPGEGMAGGFPGFQPGPLRRPPGPPVESLSAAVQLSDGRWLELAAQSQSIPLLLASQTVLFVVIASILVLMVLIWRLRMITLPMALLAQAASRLGRGEKVVPIPASGPEDVQATIRAFNEMNERVERFVTDRTHMLAALSHDLRTPMTSMRLRLEMMESSREREQLLSSLDEMQQMSEATLAFIRESGDIEAAQTVDLAALLSSVCDDLGDMGQPVSFDYEGQELLRCRPLSLKRALRNLVENAVKYGQRAEVSLTRQDNALVVKVQDYGPGIDAALQGRVFEPFFRGESSRNRKTGGVGLGLSIARQVISNHGGEIYLHNTSPGLRVEVVLPRS